MIHFLQQNGDKPVEVVAVRNGQHLNFKMTPVQTDEGGRKPIVWASAPSRCTSTSCLSPRP